MIVMPIVVLFFQENGLNLKEVMILQGTYSFMVAAMEIPSGYLADVFGRKNTLLTGSIFCFFGFLIISLSFSFWYFIIGEIILANRCVFHDRRIPLKGFMNYGVGDFHVADLDEIAERLGFRMGTVSTGDSLDSQPSDLDFMNSVTTVAKDMEAAAVAWVCALKEVPFTALKVTTDLVDGEITTEEEFVTNLQYASNRLSEGILSLVHELKDFRTE